MYNHKTSLYRESWVLKKIIGLLLYNYFARYLPVSYSRINLGSRYIRGLCGKLILCKCGKNINIEKGAVFSSHLKLGDNSGIGINASIGGNVTIGKNVMMGPECIIYTKNHEFTRTDIPMCKQGFQEEKPVTIGDDVWIGARVTILPGVNIGNGVIIGAGAVVAKDIPDYVVVVGNPAKVIKNRSLESAMIIKQNEENLRSI